MALHDIPCGVNVGFCRQSFFVRFVRKNLYGTYIDDNIPTTTYTVKHHINILADQNVVTKMLEGQKRTKSDKYVHYDQRFSR